jgi:PIN domain nuclease of toxin-antitoxin system
VKLLLDTHALLWALHQQKSLSKKVRLLLQDSNNEVFFSSISSLEMSLKVSTGKLIVDLAATFEEAESIGFKEAPFLSRHAIEMHKLPEIHSDPFDRALIAQALSDQYSLVSKDRLFPRYGVTLVW